jgi:hypothetical protein
LYWVNTVTARHQQDSSNRISHAPTLKRQFINLDPYDDMAKNNKSLKIYLDLNRYSIGLKYKMAGDGVRAKSYFEALDKSSLNKRQRFLVGLPGSILRFGLVIQQFMAAFGIRLSAFGR